MAVVEKTIIAGGGGDYTTLASWESATDLNGGADIWKGVISDNSAYDEVFTINVDGTSATSYVWLTTAGANRHAGVWDTGKARVDYSGSSNQAVQIAGDWVRVDWMQIARLSGYGSSDEGIRVSKADDILIDYCIIWCNDDGATGGMDGILFKSAAITGSVSNCVIYGWSRSGIGINQSGSVTPYDHTINVDHCAATESNTGASSSANVVFRNQWGDTIVNMYNTWFNGPAGAAGDDLRIDDGDTPETDTITVNGSHNLFDDVYYDGGGTTTENWTDNITPTDTVDDTAPATSGVYVTDYSYPTSLDLTPVVHANNALLGAGTNRIGSESDPRQDFSIDIAGNPRSATITDIGPFASALDLAETIDDGGTEADSVTASMDHARTVADGGTEADSATASLDRARAITDSGTAGDTVVVSLGHVHSEADGGTASDTATVSLGHARSEADGGIEADSATTSMELAHSEADGGIEADSATTSMELAYSEADGGTEADSATTSMGLASSEADSGSALDGSTANLGFDRAEADSGTAADSPAATLGLAHSIADSGTVGETVATSMELARSEVDGGTEADSATTSMELARSEADGGTEADTDTPELFAGLDAAVDDGGTAADSVTTAVDLSRTVADSGAVGEDVTRSVDGIRSVADSGTAGDSVAVSLGKIVAASDGGSGVDAVSIVLDYGRTPADTGTATDLATHILQWVRGQADTGSATDAITISLDYIRSEADGGTAIDSVATVIAEEVGAPDFVSRARPAVGIQSSGSELNMQSSGREAVDYG